MAAPTTKPLIQPNAQSQYEVTAEDLPLSCPMPEMYLWNSHPRVYLPIEQTGWAKCPYCGAEDTLRGGGVEGGRLGRLVRLVGLLFDDPRAELHVDALLDGGTLVVL